MMNDLETKLKELKLKTPSSQLDNRVLKERDKAYGIFRWLHQSVPLGWAAGFALAAAGIGFFAGANMNQHEMLANYRQMGVKEIHFILDESESQVFDFTVKDESRTTYQTDVKYRIEGDV